MKTLWSYYDEGYWVVLPVKAKLNNEQALTMDNGISKAFSILIPSLEQDIGCKYYEQGFSTIGIPAHRLLILPITDDLRTRFEELAEIIKTAIFLRHNFKIVFPSLSNFKTRINKKLIRELIEEELFEVMDSVEFIE